MTLFEQAYKKSHIKEDKDGWRGVPGVTMIYHGDWSDPELECDGQTRNYWDVEDSIYDFYKELKNAGDEDHLAQPQKYKFDDSDEDFNKFCQDHADDVYDCFRESRKVNASKHIKESETANAGTTEGFAEFLTRKGFNLYKSGTMENQGDVDTYEGDGNFLSLLNEYTSAETDGTRNFAYATVDNVYWYISSQTTSDDALEDEIFEDDHIDEVVDFCVVCYEA